MKLYDLSLTITEEIPVWPGDPGTYLKLISSLTEGAEANVTRIEMGAHTGTHIDATFHFEPDGAGIDQLPLDILIGPCRVYDLKGVSEGIGQKDLESLDFSGVTRALFKTENSRWWERGEKEFQEVILLRKNGKNTLIKRRVPILLNN